MPRGHLLLADWQKAFWGAELSWLLEIKRRGTAAKNEVPVVLTVLPPVGTAMVSAQANALEWDEAMLDRFSGLGHSRHLLAFRRMSAYPLTAPE
jgi:hypothetical protein